MLVGAAGAAAVAVAAVRAVVSWCNAALVPDVHCKSVE